MIGTLELRHECMKWKKGMPKPKIVYGKFGRAICSCCGESISGSIKFNKGEVK